MKIHTSVSLICIVDFPTDNRYC